MYYFYCRKEKVLISTTNTDKQGQFNKHWKWESVPYERAKRIAKRLEMSKEKDGSFTYDLPF